MPRKAGVVASAAWRAVLSHFASSSTLGVRQVSRPSGVLKQSLPSEMNTPLSSVSECSLEPT